MLVDTSDTTAETNVFTEDCTSFVCPGAYLVGEGTD